MGRKPMKDVKLPEDVHERVKALAKAEGLTTNGMVAKIVRDWLELGEAIQHRVDVRRFSR